MSKKGLQVVDRTLDVLELLSVETESIGVTEIGTRLGLNKSTVYRILSALGERGYIEKVTGKNVYKIGLKMVELSSVYLNNVELKTEARPYLRELSNKFGQPVHLATLDGLDAVYIDKFDVVNSIRLYSQIGRRIPVYCSALGKSLLSGLSDEEIQNAAKKSVYVKKTDKTIKDKEELIRQIKKVQVVGWSVDDEEHDLGVRCIAAPVFDYRGKVIAAVSVAGSNSDFPKEKDEENGALVKDIGYKISKRLGYNE